MTIYRRIALILTILAIVVNPLLSRFQEIPTKKTEETAETEEEPKRPTLFKRFLGDGGDIWTSPLHWSDKSLLCFSLVAATTGWVVANDEDIFRRIKAWQAKTPWVSDVSPVFSGLCQGASYGVAGLLLLHGLVFKDDRSREVGIMALEAMIHSFLVVQVTKHLAGRQRPSIDGVDYWNGPSGIFKRYSKGFRYYDAFFSGHTVNIWSLATVVASNYGGAVPWIAYGLASLGGLATITEDLHWLSDVLIGAVVGFSIGKLVVLNAKRRWHLTPFADSRGAGLSLTVGLK